MANADDATSSSQQRSGSSASADKLKLWLASVPLVVLVVAIVVWLIQRSPNGFDEAAFKAYCGQCTSPCSCNPTEKRLVLAVCTPEGRATLSSCDNVDLKSATGKDAVQARVEGCSSSNNPAFDELIRREPNPHEWDLFKQKCAPAEAARTKTDPAAGAPSDTATPAGTAPVASVPPVDTVAPASPPAPAPTAPKRVACPKLEAWVQQRLNPAENAPSRPVTVAVTGGQVQCAACGSLGSPPAGYAQGDCRSFTVIAAK